MSIIRVYSGGEIRTAKPLECINLLPPDTDLDEYPDVSTINAMAESVNQEP